MRALRNDCRGKGLFTKLHIIALKQIIAFENVCCIKHGVLETNGATSLSE